MQRAAIGICAHSGWGALVAVAGTPERPQVLERKRIVITDPARPGGKQPYHFAQELALADAERHIAESAAISERLAWTALAEIVARIRRDYSVAGCAVLLASGRALPVLPEILKSHSLIHTAEGEFFRRAFWKAGERLEIPVVGVRGRDLEQRARDLFGAAAEGIIRAVAGLGKSVGSPWTADQKSASLAALMILGSQERVTPV